MLPEPGTPLSVREREIMSHVADGLTDKAIASAVHLSPHTVRQHLRRACARLGARNRVHGVYLALKSGAIQ